MYLLYVLLYVFEIGRESPSELRMHFLSGFFPYPNLDWVLVLEYTAQNII